MTDEAIKAARKAAGEAARRAMIKPGCCMEGTGCELPPCHCSQVAADAAIAAFLDHYAPHHAAQGMMGPDLHELAAAVARAAQEGGEGG